MAVPVIDAVIVANAEAKISSQVNLPYLPIPSFPGALEIGHWPTPRIVGVLHQLMV